jgi:hypothetical protein
MKDVAAQLQSAEGFEFSSDVLRYFSPMLACRCSTFEWRGALNVSELAKNAVCDLDIDFQDMLALLVHYMAEACNVVSMCRCNVSTRSVD